VPRTAARAAVCIPVVPRYTERNQNEGDNMIAYPHARPGGCHTGAFHHDPRRSGSGAA
jgi:hypothetical protein